MGARNCKSFSPKRVVDERKPASSPESDFVEAAVCNVDDIGENQMKTLPLGDGKILLVKQHGKLHALGTKCTHYGALLHTGALGEGRVRCPWHGACFNIENGDIEDYPGLDSLPCYQVSVKANSVVVRAKRKDLEANRRTKGPPSNRICQEKIVVIVGGGPAGATCAESLRQEGFAGRVVLICREDVLPYDRVKVSKTWDFDVDKSVLRNSSFYRENKIETRLGVEATALDTGRSVIKLSDGAELPYDYVFIATGSKARLPEVPGANLKNIFTMRDYTDSKGALAKLSADSNVVCLGLGFVGLESAAYCVGKCASVTVVGRDTVPFRSVFGGEIGSRIKREFEEKGINFIVGQNIAKFIPNPNDPEIVNEVELTNGSVLKADLVILGIGSTFYTDWLKDSGLDMNGGAINVDEYLRTNHNNIFGGGDIACAPVYVSGTQATIGHYPLAHYHGKIAALNICGKTTALKSVPYFWTTLFGKSYRFAGHGRGTKTRIYGSLDELKFFAYHIDNGKVVAMSSVGADPIVSDYANYLYEGNSLTQEEVERDPVNWMRNTNRETFRGFALVS